MILELFPPSQLTRSMVQSCAEITLAVERWLRRGLEFDEVNVPAARETVKENEVAFALVTELKL